MIVGWRNLHNEALHNLYSSPSIITIIMSRRMRRVGHVACRVWKMNASKILVERPEGRRPLVRGRSREERTKVGLLREKSAPVPICTP
jgi:hypothetical protein